MGTIAWLTSRFCVSMARTWRVKQRTHEYSGLRRAAGFSLAELLVASFIASIVLTSLVAFAAAQSRFFRRAEERLTANQTVRLVLDVISRDLRQAGFDAHGTAVEPVLAASSTVLVLQQDDDGDGIVDTSSREVITYAFEPTMNTLSRIVGRQSMPLATGLPADGFRLSYIDTAGAALDPGASGLDATDRAAIHRVRVELLARAASGEPLAGVVSDVTLRNRPWTP
jgi:type II secretory pathway component PulJ